MNTRITRKDTTRAATRLPQIGKIRVGEKRQGANGEYPVSLDYFKATGDYAAKFQEAYPGKPNTIQIIFISDDDGQSCYEQWDGRDPQGRRAGYGDGKTWYLFNPGTQAYDPTEDQELVTKISQERQIRWKPVLTLNFLIPAIKGVFGVWQFQTSGDKSSTIAITSVYDEIKAQAGTVINIPFDLKVKKVKSNKPGSTSVYPVVNLVPNISTENMEQLRNFMEHGIDMKKIGMLTEEKLAALPEKQELNPEEVRAFHGSGEIQEAEEIPPDAPPGTVFSVKPGEKL